MDQVIDGFRQQFAACRRRSGLTYRALEKVTGIKYSALAAMQAGNRPVGEQSARRLAEALGLVGDAREAFVLAALNTSKEKVLTGVAAYPSEVLNLVGLLLLAQGISPGKITGSCYDPSIPDHLTLSLKRRRTVHVQVTLSGDLPGNHSRLHA